MSSGENSVLIQQSDLLTLVFSSSAFRLALIQLQVSSIKSDNLTRACGLVRKAAAQGAKIVSLPVSMEEPPLSGNCGPHRIVSASSGFPLVSGVQQGPLGARIVSCLSER